MSSPATRLRILYQLGWYWAAVNKGGMLHLVPPQPMAQSRTACGRLPLAGAPMEQVVLALFGEGHCCKACGGQA